jgi:hypothetical protein
VSITATSICAAGLLTTTAGYSSDSVVFLSNFSCECIAIKQKRNQTEAKKIFQGVFHFVVFNTVFFTAMALIHFKSGVGASVCTKVMGSKVYVVLKPQALDTNSLVLE